MILAKLGNIKVYGDVDYRNKDCPRESAEAVTFVNFVRNEYPIYPGMLITHIRNEGKRRKWQTERDKAEGMTKGAPDFFIPGKPSFLCELKRQDHSLCKISAEQIRYLVIAKQAGSFCCVALGWEAAVQALKDWRNMYTNV